MGRAVDDSLLGRAASYVADVRTGRVPACVWVQRACARSERDRKRERTKRFPYYFDESSAERACMSVERMPHIKGPKARPTMGASGLVYQTIHLEPWQAWFVSEVFGWQRAEDDLRRFRQALLSVPRKNAKSTLAAALMNHLFAVEGEPGAEIYAGATKRDQARIVFGVARAMALRSSGFREHFGVKVQRHNMLIESTDSVFEPLAADADNLDGLNVSGAVLDELHAHKTRELYDVIETAMGARLEPLLLLITTAGVNVAGICYEVLTYLRKILEGAVQDETFFGVDYTIDAGDETRWHDVSVQRKANPNWGVSVMPDDLARTALKAKHSPAAVNNFLTKRLNVWVRGEATSGLTVQVWDKCRDESLTAERLRGLPWWAGVDLAEVDDIAAVMRLTELDDGRLALSGRYYLPESAVEASKNAQYPGWVREGRIIVTDGSAVDYQRIEDDLVKDCETCPGVRELAFDRALASRMLQNLERRLQDDPKVVVVKQDWATIPSVWAEFKALALAGKLAHDGDPVLLWMVSNLAIRRNDQGEEMPCKAGGKDSPNKIDGISASLNALSRLLESRAVEEPYAGGRGLVWLSAD